MANFKHLQIALEAIEFQNGAFFKELELTLNPAFSKGTRPNKEEQTTLGLQLDKLIFRHTGVKSKITFTNYGTAVYVPDISAKNILNNDWGMFSSAEDGLKMIKEAGDSGVSIGIVDLKKSRITGDFSKYEVVINVDLNHFDHHHFTAAECAAVILHEIGHWFTYCEMLDRLVTGNILLEGLSRSLSGGDVSEREIAIKKVGDIVDMENSVIQDLQKSTSDKAVVSVFITEIYDRIMSKEGHSFYDSNTWEMLSDQFAMRHGAGRHIVTALDKIFVTGGMLQRRSNFVYYLGELMKTAFAVASIVCVFIPVTQIASVIYLCIAYWMMSYDHQSDGAPAYDKPKDRFLRARRQLVEQSKNTSLSEEMIVSLIEDVNVIDKVLSNYNDRIGWLEAIDNFLFKSSRRRRDSVNLQRDLEKLALNDLFLSAASLRTV